MESIRNIVNILSIQSGDGNSSVISEVNVELRLESLDLVERQACEGEHPNLLDHMVPVQVGALGLNSVIKSLSHGADSVAHDSEFSVPLGGQALV